MRKNVNNDLSKDLPIAWGMRALFKDWYNFGNFQVIWKYAMFKWQIYDMCQRLKYFKCRYTVPLKSKLPVASRSLHYENSVAQESLNQKFLVNNAPVYQSVTPKSADDCKNNHQAFNKDYAHKTNHYQKPKDIGGEPRHVYENFGKHDDQTEV